LILKIGRFLIKTGTDYGSKTGFGRFFGLSTDFVGFKNRYYSSFLIPKSESPLWLPDETNCRAAGHVPGAYEALQFRFLLPGD
jgi:hypothetical protein